MSTLFRPEAVAAQSSHLHGDIRLATPPRLMAVALVALALLAALVAFAVLGEATRKVRVGGVLLPSGGLFQLTAPQPARLHELSVREGDVVDAGQVLAVLQLGGRSGKGDTAALLDHSLRARMEALRSEARSLQAQADQRQAALRERLHSLQADELQAQGELEAVQGRVQIAQASLQRDSSLAAQGFLSDAQLQVRREALLELQIRERSARRALEVLRRETQGVQAEIQGTRLQARAQQAQVDRALAALEQEGAELAARDMLQLLAPRPGVVGHVPVHAGQSLQVGQTLLSLLPATRSGQPLRAELYAASRTCGFVEPGQPVWLRLHAFPYQKFGMLPGQVVDVSRTPVLPQDLPGGLAQVLLDAAQAHEPLYRITVAMQADSLHAYGRSRALKPGMTLDADVIQDRRALWEWAFEPLLAARQRWQISSVPRWPHRAADSGQAAAESESARSDNQEKET